MERSLTFFIKNFACSEICMKYRFCFLEKLRREANVILLNCNSLQRRHFKDSVNGVSENKTLFFLIIQNSIWLLISTCCYYESLWITGLRMFNMISFLALCKINIFFNSSYTWDFNSLYTFGINLCVHMCSCGTNILFYSFLFVSFIPVFIMASWKPSIKYNDICPPAGFVTLKPSILSKELMNF